MVKRSLGPTMKSVGEVMAIGRSFEESLQKSIRMLDTGRDGLVLSRRDESLPNEEQVEESLTHPDDRILYNVASAIALGMSTKKIYSLSAIDPWFIEKIRNIVDMGKKLPDARDKSKMRKAKQLGFSDAQIARAQKTTTSSVREKRLSLGIKPCVKQIDTLAAEWPAKTNYLYMTYGGDSDDIKIPDNSKNIIVLGAGPYRIGSSVEFDWGTVNMVLGLKKQKTDDIIVVNCNPETVSTDYDVSDRLYFEELTVERILDIAEFESPHGVITCVGGQTANNLTPELAENKIPILGTAAVDVDRAENRSTFSSVLDSMHIRQPPGRRLLT